MLVVFDTSGLWYLLVFFFGGGGRGGSLKSFSSAFARTKIDSAATMWIKLGKETLFLEVFLHITWKIARKTN